MQFHRSSRKNIWASTQWKYVEKCKVKNEKLRDYRVYQQVWNRLKAMFWYSEAYERSELFFAKIVFCSKKLLFQPFLWTASNENGIFSNFAPIVLCSNLFSELLKIGEKLLKIPFSILQFTKKAEKAILRSRIQTFFVNDARFAHKHF